MSHGGDRYTFQIKLDFSVNINPLGMPPGVEQSLRESWKRAGFYPDLQARKLFSRLAALWKVKPENLLAGNGASELLMAAVHAVRPEKALLPVPSFLGYEHVLKAVGSRLVYYEMSPEKQFSLDADFLPALEQDADILFLTNPNNPTGRYIPADLLETILDRCSEKRIPVILDECFMELSDDPRGRSLCGQTDRWPNLLVLRAFTKSFAIPGIRLGYAVCGDPKLAASIRARLPEWNLSVPAQEAGCAALQELSWLSDARRVIRQEREVLENALTELGFEVFHSDAGYLMMRDQRSRRIDWYRALLKTGTLIRDCSDYAGLEKGYYRIAVRCAEENRELLRQIRKIASDAVNNESSDSESCEIFKTKGA